MLRFFAILFLFFSFNTLSLKGQTCCSGGVPTSSNLGLPPGATKTFQFRYNYDLNTLNTQKTGRTKATQPQSFRRTHAHMFQLGYNLNKRFSFDAFIPFVRQERRSNINDSEETTFGLGDVVFLLKYALWANEDKSSVVTLGTGVELPTGKTDFNNSFGNVLLADLQPGSGSYDMVFWGQFLHNFKARPTLNWLSQTTLKINGQNEDFGEGLTATTYRFGNEFQFLTGLSDRILLGKSLVDPSLLIRYRRTLSDRSRPNNIPQDLTEVPSTGGQWIFLNPSFSVWLNTDWSVTLGVEFPLFADIVGTQVTPTYRFNAGMYYRLSLKEKETALPN